MIYYLPDIGFLSTADVHLEQVSWWRHTRDIPMAEEVGELPYNYWSRSYCESLGPARTAERGDPIAEVIGWICFIVDDYSVSVYGY